MIKKVDPKDTFQIIVIQNGVEQFNITNPQAVVLNVMHDHPTEEDKTSSQIVVYGDPKSVFYAQRELDKQVQKNVLKGILHFLSDDDDEDDADEDKETKV